MNHNVIFSLIQKSTRFSLISQIGQVLERCENLKPCECQIEPHYYSIELNLHKKATYFFLHSLSPSVVGRIMPSPTKDAPVFILSTCEYVSLHGKRDFQM